MDYEQIAQPYQDARVDNLRREDGTIDTFPAIDTSIPARQLIKNINDRIEDSVNYWDDMQGYNLRYARAQSFRMVIGKQIDTSKLYRYQIPYIDNEIHIAIDAIISYVCAQEPRPEVYPADNSDEAKILSRDLEKALSAHSHLMDLQQKLEQAVFNLLIKRVGILKLYFDPEYGNKGEIVVESLDPDWVIVDKNVKEKGNPQWICEIHKNSLEELISRFPNKKNELMDILSVKRGTPRQMSQEVVWREVWATVYNKKNEPEEWVFMFCKDIMLDMFPNPNWLYNGNGGKLKNFLQAPMKPYIPFNYLNDGSHWIDQTTPTEQAYSMQDVLNKRGRQIMENADTANGFLVFSTDAVTNDDVENLTGDPNQRLTINTLGRPITEFVTQIPPHMLPDYVMDDKIDARSTLHSLMGTPAQFTGTNQSEAGKDQTLGEAVMIKNQAQGRQDRLVRAVERSASIYFNFLAQMMAVHYDDKHWFVYNGGDGDYDRIVMTRNMIDSGMQVSVRAGTTLPFDKAQRQSIALNLAKMGAISILDLYKDLGMDNPQQRYDNWMKFKTAPQELARDAFNEMEDQEAYVEYIEILDGNYRSVKPKEDASVEHILSHRKQMITEKFLTADRDRQKKMVEIVEKEADSLEARQQLDQLSQGGAQALNPVNPPMPQPMNAPVGMAGSPMAMTQQPGLNGNPLPPAMPMGGLPPMPPQTIGQVMGQGQQPPIAPPMPATPEAPPQLNMQNPMEIPNV